MRGVAHELATWATTYRPSTEDCALADRSLLDVLAVTASARDDPLRDLIGGLAESAQWSALGHVNDFDDLHMPSTSHISVVCVPAALACGGDARAYLAGAGVMARLGTALGWSHYAAGWHATCTAGAPAAAVAAAVALGLDAERTAVAMALAVPAAGGVQRAFGTQAKSLQVGFCTDAGVRAARLAAAGASADPAAMDQWLSLVAGNEADLTIEGPAIPGGLAVKLHPCCYALQRPIAAVRQAGVRAEDVVGVRVRTPGGTVHPLIHSRPTTGLEAKFSLEYGVAVALLDDLPGFASFSDHAVRRTDARRLVDCVEVERTPGGDWLLAGDCRVDVELVDGTTKSVTLDMPPGSPARPVSDADMTAKVRDCAGEYAEQVVAATWADAADVLRRILAPATDATL